MAARSAPLAIIGFMALCAALPSPSSSIASSAGVPSDQDCSNVAAIMLDCLSYVTNGSYASNPTKACCAGVATVVKDSVGCICDALKQASDLGVAINLTRVLALPRACSVEAPDVHCDALNPGASPSPAPASPTPQSSPSPSLPPEKPGPPPVPSPTQVPPPSDSPAAAPDEPPSSGAQQMLSSLLLVLAAGIVAVLFLVLID